METQFSIFMTSASVFNAINWLTPLQFATYTMINVVLASEVPSMSNENDYIKRHEFERSNGKIYERINQTDRKLVELSGKIDTQNAIQEKTFNLKNVQRNI